MEQEILYITTLSDKEINNKLLLITEQKPTESTYCLVNYELLLNKIAFLKVLLPLNSEYKKNQLIQTQDLEMPCSKVIKEALVNLKDGDYYFLNETLCYFNEEKFYSQPSYQEVDKEKLSQIQVWKIIKEIIP